jgi:hypothetical protein
MRPFIALVLITIAGGAGGLIGSILGAAFGRSALFVGGLLGGLITSPAAVVLLGRLRWIESADVKGMAVGAAIGFVAAVLVAVNTLSSPVGPLLSTLLVGTGALVGRRVARGSRL